MARRSRSDGPSLSRLERCAVVVLGACLAGVGANAMTSGRVEYLNYLRLPMLAPLALAAGIALIAAGVLMRD